MEKSLIFLCISCTHLIFSIIVICTVPIINGDINNGSNWGELNCQYYRDSIKYYREKQFLDKIIKEEYLELLENEKKFCDRKKGMYGLEYSSCIIELIIGFICSLLSLFHNFDVGKDFEKKNGLIRALCGIIGFFISLIYIIYSCLVFTHDGPGKYNNVSNPPIFSTSSPSPLIYYDIFKLDKDRSIAKWDSSKKQYICLYFKENVEDSFYAKYKDLGEKQYNYHKDFFLNDGNADIQKCNIKNHNQHSSIYEECKDPKIYTNENDRPSNSENKKCEYLYFDDESINGINNKYIYNKWITSIIFISFILCLNIGLIIFGFWILIC